MSSSNPLLLLQAPPCALTPTPNPPAHPPTHPQIFKDKAMVETMVGVKQKSQYRAVVEKAMGAATVSA